MMFNVSSGPVVDRERGVSCSQDTKEVPAEGNAAIGVNIVRSYVPIRVQCDKVEGAKSIKCSKFHLCEIVQTFQPKRETNAGLCRDV